MLTLSTRPETLVHLGASCSLTPCAQAQSPGITLPAYFCPWSSPPQPGLQRPSDLAAGWCNRLLHATFRSASHGPWGTVTCQCCPGLWFADYSVFGALRQVCAHLSSQFPLLASPLWLQRQRTVVLKWLTSPPLSSLSSLCLSCHLTSSNPSLKIHAAISPS